MGAVHRMANLHINLHY